MAIRIEYLLVFVILLLLLSMLSINPRSEAVTSSKGDKEIEFQNFSLYDIKKDEPLETMSASKMIKYKNYINLNNIDVKGENGYQLLSQEATYEEDYIYMDKGVNIFHKDGLAFSTESLNYNTKTKDIKTLKPFLLEFNSSIIQGKNLALNMNSKIISADNIKAKIVFVSTNDETIQ